MKRCHKRTHTHKTQKECWEWESNERTYERTHTITHSLSPTTTFSEKFNYVSLCHLNDIKWPKAHMRDVRRNNIVCCFEDHEVTVETKSKNNILRACVAYYVLCWSHIIHLNFILGIFISSLIKNYMSMKADFRPI